MVIILYLIVGVLFAIFNHHTVAELVDERARDTPMDEDVANGLMHIALIFLALFWPYFVVALIVGFVKHLIFLIKGGNEQ